MNDMRLTKTVPTHNVSQTFTWIKKDFMLFGTFRQAREKVNMKVQSKCFWCKQPFKDEDMLALGCRSTKGNILMCQTCANEAKP